MNDLERVGTSRQAEARRLSRVRLRANEWEWAGFWGAMPPQPPSSATAYVYKLIHECNVMFELGLFNSQAQTFFF